MTAELLTIDEIAKANNTTAEEILQDSIDRNLQMLARVDRKTNYVLQNMSSGEDVKTIPDSDFSTVVLTPETLKKLRTSGHVTIRCVFNELNLAETVQRRQAQMKRRGGFIGLVQAEKNEKTESARIEIGQVIINNYYSNGTHETQSASTTAELTAERVQLLKAVGELLDGTHENCAPELQVALRCWLDLYADTARPLGKLSPKKRITDWLVENAGEFTSTAHERINTVVVPKKFKGGGAPKSSG